MSEGGSSSRATILLIEEDDDTRPILRKNLQRNGYRVLVALDEEDALERVSDWGARADLLLVNLVGKTSGEALTIGQRIREHGKFDGATPLIIMAEKFSKDLEGTNVNVSENDWITYLEDSYQLQLLLARLTGKAPS